MLAASPNVEQASDVFFFFFCCVLTVLLLQRTDSGSSRRWDEGSTRSGHVLYRSREMPLTRIQLHHSMAAASQRSLIII